MDALHYYGVDWIAMFMSLASIYLLGNKNRWGFLVFAMANAIWIFLGLTWMHSLGIAIGNIIFMLINLRGFWRWQQAE